MPKIIFERLNYPSLSPTLIRLQLADTLSRYLEGIVDNLSVKIQGSYIPVDFVVLDMVGDPGMPLILGRPFLSSVKARINVRTGVVQFRLGRRTEKFRFQQREEQRYLIVCKPNLFADLEESHSQTMDPPIAPPKSKKNRKVWQVKMLSSSTSSPGTDTSTSS